MLLKTTTPNSIRTKYSITTNITTTKQNEIKFFRLQMNASEGMELPITDNNFHFFKYTDLGGGELPTVLYY